MNREGPGAVAERAKRFTRRLWDGRARRPQARNLGATGGTTGAQYSKGRPADM